MKAKVVKSIQEHLVGLIGEVAREREIEGAMHYHLKFKEFPGTLYHFMQSSVEIIEESNAEVDAS